MPKLGNSLIIPLPQAFGIVAICLTIHGILSFSPKFKVIKENWWEEIIFVVEMVYYSFVVLATLCLIRLTSLLPQILSTNNPLFDKVADGTPRSDIANIGNILLYMKLSTFFSEHFLFSFPMACIVIFIISRFFLDIINIIWGNIIVTRAIMRAKAVWIGTLVLWAAIFTIISTVAILISTS